MRTSRFAKSVTCVIAFVLTVSALTGCERSNGGDDSSSSPTTDSRSAAEQVAAVQEEVAGLDCTVDIAVLVTDAQAEANAAREAADADAKDAKLADASKVATAKVEALKQRSAKCNPADTTSSTAGGENPDGTLAVLPVATGDETISSIYDPNTPPTYADAAAQGPVLNWCDLRDRMGGFGYYTQGVNDRAGNTGFTWGDLDRFCETGKTYQALAIHVFGLDVSEAEAQQLAAERYPTVPRNLIDTLPIVRHAAGFNNTMGDGSFQDGVMKDYIDRRNMVRISLSPFIYDEAGNPTSISGRSGVFVDCYNVWWLMRQIVWDSKVPPAPSKCPEGMIGTPPNCDWPPTPVNPTPPNPTPEPGKDPSRSTDRQGNNKPGGNQGGQLQPAPVEPASPPAAGDPPQTYTPPAPLPKPPAPIPDPAPVPTPEPSVNPDDGSGNDGDQGGF